MQPGWIIRRGGLATRMGFVLARGSAGAWDLVWDKGLDEYMEVKFKGVLDSSQCIPKPLTLPINQEATASLLLPRPNQVRHSRFSHTTSNGAALNIEE